MPAWSPTCGTAFVCGISSSCLRVYSCWCGLVLLQFTPLYFGTPGAFKDSQPPLGGGYVEPWGLHSIPGVLHCSEDGCTGVSACCATALAAAS